MLHVAFTSHLAGTPERLADPRSQTLSSHYGYMLNGAVVDCQPFGVEGSEVDRGKLADYSSEASVGRFDAGTFACDAALEVCETLMRDAAPIVPAALVYCHSSIDECNEWVPATRLAKQLRLVNPLCFAISQLSHGAVFMALKILSAQMAVDPDLGTAIVVAADKWLFPYVQSFGALGACGDGAGALLLDSTVDARGPELIGIAIEPADGALEVFGSGSYSVDLKKLAERVVGSLKGLLTDVPDDARSHRLVVVGPSAPLELASSVASGLGLSLPKANGTDLLHLSCADPIVALGRQWLDVSEPGVLTLWWTVGSSGEIGCALLRMSNRQQATTEADK